MAILAAYLLRDEFSLVNFDNRIHIQQVHS